MRIEIPFALALIACSSPQMTGAGLPLNMQPAPPLFAGAYDFDLLGPVRGKACLQRSYMFGDQHHYWISAAGLRDVSHDPLTSEAINAAAFNAINELSGADTIVVTRVVTEPQSSDEVCAYVYGRAIRLTKAQLTSKPDAVVPEKHEQPDDLANP